MRARDRQEWCNYWATRRGLHGWWVASRQASGAVTSWVHRKTRKRTVLPLPGYLSTGDVHSACEPHVAQALPPTPTSAPALNLSEELRAWAEGYQGKYRNFLEGDLHRSADPEDHWTLHQFGWLLALVAGRAVDADRARGYVDRWIEKLGEAREDPAWRSFSLGERLSNWIDLFQLIPVGTLWPRLAESITTQAVHLAQHLETDIGGSGNNHLLSNGRALYVVGRLFNHGGLTRLGGAVLVHEAKRQLTSDGFLNEGSSHYQLIVTRAYLEALRAARLTGDPGTAEALAPTVATMLRACAFFHDAEAKKWSIPFFGDISPDPPPCFFGTSTRFWQLVEAASAWRGGTGPVEDMSVPWFAGRDGADAEPAERRNGWLCYGESGYYRWDSEQYVIWWHARNSDEARWHSHNDWGSFQLHAHGTPVLIDPGRESYGVVDAVYDGRLTLAQNGVSVDGFEQALFLKRDLFAPEYLEHNTHVEWHGDDKAAVLRTRIHGYERLRAPVVHVRTFRLSPDAVTIEDAFDGRGNHTVMVAFHLHPDVRSSPEGDGSLRLTTRQGRRVHLVLAKGAAVTVKRGGSPATAGGYCTTRYGTRRETTSIFAQYRGGVPMTLEHRILLG